MTQYLAAIIAGAVAYALAQFLWYAPFAFGPVALSLRGTSAQATKRRLKHRGVAPELLAGVVVPALLLSSALVALRLVIGLGSPISWFAAATLVLGSATILPKYVRWIVTRQWPTALIRLQDGAFLLSLMATVSAIIVMT